ncbi:helix-turn-helix domain-containing protein [Amycolatopsis alkalitolerans]|uniref:Helix-turn-helix transcriptional regulator n=1 Tax=Amycolatopsis alkalitolerans TaxID=2547244 RepID=A0A5C4M4J5_9PSEU|nr:XRE family transcriptional regulator [Amycolatopsis alkalitolerans]TNC26514.1 helix-turn-helix transcriptional regulator [Amycolatopsis alkalitolerans]
MTDVFSDRLALAVREARVAHGLPVSALAERSGISRAMIGKIERGEVQPTAALLARLSGTLGLTLSELIARAEGDERRVSRAAEQEVWVDPETGYRRRPISPPAGGPLELVQIELPPGARVPVSADTYTFIHQQIWVLDGRLTFHEGEFVHDLGSGDCLQLGPPAPCTYVNATREPCRYVVAIAKR